MSPAHNHIRVLAASRNSRPFVDDTGQGKVSRRRPKAMEIRRSGSQPSGKGPAEYFSGTVRIDPLFDAHEPARVRAASVTSGLGWVQRWGGSIQEIRPGDVVWFSPGEKHWHGATPGTAMTHIAIQEALNGSPVDWMEKVSDAQYHAESR